MPNHSGSSPLDRLRHAGLIIGPVTFIGAWLAAGASTEGYSPVRDHISDLDAVDAPTRPMMNAAFTTFALGVGMAAGPMRIRLGHPTALALYANAVVSLGVMAAPLGRSKAGDRLHGVMAGLGYLVLAATAPSAAPALNKRSPWMARISIAVGATSMACLVASLIRPQKGFWQRAGITTTDAWLIACGIIGVAGREPVTSRGGSGRGMTRTLPRD